MTREQLISPDSKAWERRKKEKKFAVCDINGLSELNIDAGTQFFDVDFINCTLDNANFSACRLEYVTFEDRYKSPPNETASGSTNSSLKGAIFNKTTLAHCTIPQGTNLSHAFITNATISNTDLWGDITGVNWQGTTLHNVDFSKASFLCNPGRWGNVTLDRYTINTLKASGIWSGVLEQFEMELLSENEGEFRLVTKPLSQLTDSDTDKPDSSPQIQIDKAPLLGKSELRPANSKTRNLVIATVAVSLPYIFSGLIYGIHSTTDHLNQLNKMLDIYSNNAQTMKITAGALSPLLAIMIGYCIWSHYNDLKKPIISEQQNETAATSETHNNGAV